MALCNTEINKATPTNFQLIFPILPVTSALTDSNSLTLNIHSVVLPGMQLEELERRWQGYRSKDSGAITFDPLTTTFIVDGSFENWQLIYQWITYISDGYEKPMEEHGEFSVDSTLMVTNNFSSPVLAVQFVSMWPQALGEVSLSYREGEVQIECTVTFVYDYYKLLSV